MLKHLKRIYNLVFLKYKLLFTYLKILFEVLISIARILMFRDFFKLRSNSKKV